MHAFRAEGPNAPLRQRGHLQLALSGGLKSQPCPPSFQPGSRALASHVWGPQTAVCYTGKLGRPAALEWEWVGSEVGEQA